MVYTSQKSTQDLSAVKMIRELFEEDEKRK
jgi:hypothetical protein